MGSSRTSRDPAPDVAGLTSPHHGDGITRSATSWAASSWRSGRRGCRSRGVMAMVDSPRRSWTTRGVDSALEGQGRPGVAEAVEGQARQPVTADSTEEGGAERVGPGPGAVGLVEDEAEVVEVGAHEQALFGMRRRWSRRAATVARSRATERRDRVGAGTDGADPQPRPHRPRQSTRRQPLRRPPRRHPPPPPRRSLHHPQRPSRQAPDPASPIDAVGSNRTGRRKA